MTLTNEAKLDRIRNPECTACPLGALAKNVCLPGKGNPNAEIMVVLDRPRAYEDATGQGFQGRQAELLQELLQNAGAAHLVWITYAVKCKGDDKAPPTLDIIQECRGYLRREILTIKPKIVVIMGNEIRSAFGVVGARGEIIKNHVFPDSKVKVDVLLGEDPLILLTEPNLREQLAQYLLNARNYE